MHRLPVSIFFDCLSILSVRVLVYFFNLFFFEQLKFSPNLTIFCLCLFVCTLIFLSYALLNYSYDD